MLDFLSLALLLGAAFFAGAFGFSGNYRWSTADFLPIVFWIVVSSIFSILLDLLLKYQFGVDGKSLPTAIGLVVLGCGVRWYRIRSRR